MRATAIACLGTFLLGAGEANSRGSSQEYAAMGRKAWSAFECSALASVIDRPEQQRRLFLLGYEQGKDFINALRTEKVEKEDVDRNVPIIVLLLLEGPNPDFMLGRIYENAQRAVLDSLGEELDEYSSETVRKATAENEFRMRNCELIGK